MNPRALSEPGLAATLFEEDALETGAEGGVSHLESKGTELQTDLSRPLRQRLNSRMAHQNDKTPGPLIEKLTDALRGVSIEKEFAPRTAHHSQDGEPLSSSYIYKILRGEETPSLDRMEMFANMLGIAPEMFLEYRLACARELFDERVVGLEAAVETLNQFEQQVRIEVRRRSATPAARPKRSRRTKRTTQTGGSTPPGDAGR
jgi:transcriptional regulator with XRE-family HTH domain